MKIEIKKEINEIKKEVKYDFFIFMGGKYINKEYSLDILELLNVLSMKNNEKRSIFLWQDKTTQLFLNGQESVSVFKKDKTYFLKVSIIGKNKIELLKMDEDLLINSLLKLKNKLFKDMMKMGKNYRLMLSVEDILFDFGDTWIPNVPFAIEKAIKGMGKNFEYSYVY